MKSKSRASSDRVTLGERVVAALLTPLFFNAAVVIVVATLFRRGFYPLMSLHSVYGHLGKGGLMMVVAPAIVGFLAGSEGTARIFGHAFFTHHGSQRNRLVTALVWSVFAAAVWFVNSAVPQR